VETLKRGQMPFPDMKVPRRSQQKLWVVLPDRMFTCYLPKVGEDTGEEADHEDEMKKCHDLPLAGHPGVRRTLELLIRKKKKWKGM
jgi:hypothetical protein